MGYRNIIKGEGCKSGMLVTLGGQCTMRCALIVPPRKFLNFTPSNITFVLDLHNL